MNKSWCYYWQKQIKKTIILAYYKKFLEAMMLAEVNLSYDVHSD